MNIARKARTWLSPLAFLLLAACFGGGKQPPTGAAEGLSILTPAPGQVVAGTIALAASGRGGPMSGLVFELGGLEAVAGADGTAILDTRSLSDGPATLIASAQVGGKSVSRTVELTVQNDLPSAGTVGADGGALKSEGGSLAMIPPGAVEGSVELSVADMSQEEIRAEFGVDYEALGITFLGALRVTAAGAAGSKIPYQVDLAGFAERVKPGEQVLMFSLLPDADGDGVGELMMVADAQATADGSVITRPVPKAEALGFSGLGGAGLRSLATPTVRPGELLTLEARGFVPGSVYGNVAVFEPGGLQVLARASAVGSGSFNPTMALEVAVPDLPGGTASVRFKNLSTGFATGPLDLVLASATGDAWRGFLAQLELAVAQLTQQEPELAQQAGSWLDALQGASPPAAAMAAQSGLVSEENRRLLEDISEGYSSQRREAVFRHALLLDAVAASDPAIAAPAASLARLLLVARPPSGGGGSPGNLAAQQSGSGNCLAAGSEIFGPTGMGSGPPPGGSACGGAGGGGDDGGGLESQQVAGFGPVEGAVVRILRRGTNERLSPFTTVTDEAGYYYIPFIPQGEPFTVHAIDPKTGQTATAEGVGPQAGGSAVFPLAFVPAAQDPAAPTARFSVNALRPGHFSFDASGSSDPNGEIVEYIWNFGDGRPALDDEGDPLGPLESVIEHEFYLPGTFTVSLVVVDDEGKAGAAQQTISVPVERVVVPVLPIGVAEMANENSYFHLEPGSMSQDGRYVAFNADGPDLTGQGRWSDDDEHLYRVDLETGEIVLVDETADGQVANGAPGGSGTNQFPAISAGGRFVTFSSGASNLVPNDTNGEESYTHDIFRKDLQTGEISRINMTADGGEGQFGAHQPTASADGLMIGGVVAWRIVAKNLATDEFTVVTPVENQSNGGPQVSADGRFIVFSGGATHPPQINVMDLETKELEIASTAAGGTPGNDYSTQPSISGDGRYVVFRSSASNLVPGDANNADDIFFKDRETGEIRILSQTADGAQPNYVWAPVISADGRWVTFSAEYPDAEGNRGDRAPYVVDLRTGERTRIDLTPTGAVPSHVVWDEYTRISADGRYITFNYDADVPTYVPDFAGKNLYRLENPLWEP